MAGYDRIIRRALLVAFALGALLAVLGIVMLRLVVSSMETVAFHHAAEINTIARLHVSFEETERYARRYLLASDGAARADIDAAYRAIEERLKHLHSNADTTDEIELLASLAQAERAYEAAFERALSTRERGAEGDAIVAAFEEAVEPARRARSEMLIELAALNDRQLEAAEAKARTTAHGALALLAGLFSASIVITTALAVRLGHALRSQQADRAQLVAQTSRLDEINRELDAFAGRVSHDLRNVLSPLLLSSAMARGARADSDVDQLVKRMERSVRRALAMLDGLLAFSRSARSDPTASSAVAPVVEDVLEELAPLIASESIDAEYLIDEAKVACSRELLQIVLMNVVGNALKYMDGRPGSRLRIMARVEAAECAIVVEDTGPGIPKEALHRVFEPFYRVPGEKAPGLGIGLATVRRVIKAHGGRIELESEVGVGTVVRIWLPLAR